MSEKRITTESIVNDLRVIERYPQNVNAPYICRLAAERLEELTQDIDEWIAIFDMLNDRENRHGYLDWWREKNGKSELCYPDGDEVYKDFFAMKSRAEEAEAEVVRLKKILNLYALQYGTVSAKGGVTDD